ncbi:hypothetical protein A4A49_60065, partial [Nicotiana attenuata]
PGIIILSVPLFATSLDTNFVSKACGLCKTQQDFCYSVLAQNPEAQKATTKHDLEGITINLAFQNYTAIARRVLFVTTNETDPKLKEIYRNCLHQYLLMRSDFQFINDTFNSNGDVVQSLWGASTHLTNCIYYFMSNTPPPNPFAEDNDNMGAFIGLIRDICYIDL